MFAIAIVAIAFGYASNLRTRVKRHHSSINTLRERGFHVECIAWAPALASRRDKVLSNLGLNPWVNAVFVDFRSRNIRESDIRESIPLLLTLIPRSKIQKPALKLDEALPVEFVEQLSQTVSNCTIEYQNKRNWQPQ